MAYVCNGCGDAEPKPPPAKELQRPDCRHYMRFCAGCAERFTPELQLAKPCDTCAERAQRNGGSK